MTLSKFMYDHEHSVVTLIVVLIACLFGLGFYALVLMSGVWVGREHAQAEYRYMKLHGINRSDLKWYDGFKTEAWDRDSSLYDMVFPIVIGGLVCGLSWLF